MKFNQQLQIDSILPSENLSIDKRKQIKRCLWKTKENRTFKIQQYNFVIEKLNELKVNIDTELNELN